jgi:nitrogen fixation protein NifZ
MRQEIRVPLQTGDMVFAHEEIRSDGHVPEYEEASLLAASGTRGVVVRVGHVENQPETLIYLVQFETAPGELGPPIGCLAHELRVLDEEASDEEPPAHDEPTQLSQNRQA